MESKLNDSSSIGRKKSPHAAPSACRTPRGRFLPWGRPGGKRNGQRLALAIILALGLALGIAIMRMGDSPAQQAHSRGGHAPEASHADGAADGHDHDHEDDETGHGSRHVDMSEAQIQAAGLTLERAGPASIRNAMRLPGEIRFNEDWTAHVVPRLAGVVESVPAGLGQTVRKGDVLAVLASTGLSDLRSEWQAAQKRLALARTTYARERQLWQEKISAEQDYLQARLALREAEIAAANAQDKLAAIGAPPQSPEGLNRYEVRAPFDGVIVEKHVANGEAVREDSGIFTISDLSSVWAEIKVPASALGIVKVGETAVVQAVAFDSRARGKVGFVGALVGQETRTAQAWVVLPNPDMAWRPGLFVNVDVLADAAQATVAVRADAVQEVDGVPAVFVRTPEGFAMKPVTLGRRDAQRVEITDGLAAGEIYVAEGGFVLKSELGKGSAEHSH